MKPQWHEARIKLEVLEGRDAFVKPDLKDSQTVWVFNGVKRLRLSADEFAQLEATKAIRLGPALTLRRHREIESTYRKSPTITLTPEQQAA